METPIEFERVRAYRRLVDLIFKGGVDADTPLSERKLAEQFGIGRMPVREALRQLEQEGVIEVKPARGTFIRRLASGDLTETYQVREALECLAAEQAATKGVTPALVACGVRLRAMERDPSAFTAVEIDDAGTEFHKLLTEACANAVLIETIHLLRRRSRLAFHLPRYFDTGVVHATLFEHVAILSAIEQRNPVKARELMRDHLQRGLAIRLKLEAISGREQPANEKTPRGMETLND